MFNKWVRLVPKITHGEKVKCPKCEKTYVSYQYVGDEKTRIGYLSIWCSTCNKGIRLSRVKVPNNFNMLSFESDVSSVIPNYENIES